MFLETKEEFGKAMKKKKEGCWIFVKKGRNAGPILGTRGQILGAKESLNGRKKNGPKSKLRGRSLLFFAPFFEKIFIEKIPFS